MRDYSGGGGLPRMALRGLGLIPVTIQCGKLRHVSVLRLCFLICIMALMIFPFTTVLRRKRGNACRVLSTPLSKRYTDSDNFCI